MYVPRLKQALDARKAATPPKIGWLLLTAVPLVVVYLIASLLIIPAGEPDEFNFRDERGSVTALSAIFLAMGSAFALVSFASSSTCWPRVFWLLISAALGFFALDELLEFHERLGRYLDQRQVSELANSFRNWNDIIVITYGLVGLVGMVLLLPTALQYPRYLELFGAAFLFYVIHTIIDSTQEPPTTTSVVLEESAKLFCSAMLAVAQFAGLQNVLRK